MSNRIIHVLKVEYDGTNYSGWQRQTNGNSVQQSIEEALKKLTGHEIHVLGSGRTDAGVHARGQIAHFKTPIEMFSVPEDKIIRAINSRLPKDIRILGHCIPKGDFHCTRDAIYREYSYTMTCIEHVFNRYFSTYYPYPLDEEKLLASGDLFIGEHDFTSFSKVNTDVKTNICTVTKAQWVRVDEFNYYFEITADRFLRNMVRAAVGTLIEIGSGKSCPESILDVLEEKDRGAAAISVPAHGLFLWEVLY